MSAPPCAGKWELFDSTDPNDHRIARAMCAACPIVAACLQSLELARSEAHVPDKYGPAGTWAGQLMGRPVGRPPTVQIRLAAEEQMFTEDEAKEAHASYSAGFRDPRTVVGERVYQRRKKRSQYARKVAA